MRESSVKAFEDLRARSRQPLAQMGRFSPSVLRSTPVDQLDLSAEIRSDQATFLSFDNGKVQAFRGSNA